MSEIRCNPEALRRVSQNFDQTALDLEQVSRRIVSLGSSLNWHVRAQGNVDSNIQSAINSAKKLAGECEQLGRYLSRAAQLLQDADSQGIECVRSIQPVRMRIIFEPKPNYRKTFIPVPIRYTIGEWLRKVVGSVIIPFVPITQLGWISQVISSDFKQPDTSEANTNQSPGPSVIFPVKDSEILPGRGFGAYAAGLKGDQSSGGHKGVDIGGNRGDPIHSAIGGTVVRAEYSESYGNVVYVNVVIEGKEYQLRYAHLDAIDPAITNALKTKTPISQNVIIGKMGDTGSKEYVNGVHLHFEVRESPDGKPCKVDNSSIPQNPEGFL